MSQGDLLTDTDFRTRPLKEPAKRWRNWWHTKAGYIAECSICLKTLVGPVDHPNCCKFYPSKDLAETAVSGETEGQCFRWLGAHPEP